MVDSIHYIRKLTAFLVVSGSLNIILIVFLFYLAISERPPTPYIELKPANKQEQQISLATERSDSEVIRYFRRMPLQWLISRLNNTQLVENGYTQRDLALASLVAFHYFDLERAFSKLSKPEQKRRIIFGQFRDGRSAELIVYPGLSDKHFEAIRAFAATEQWPLTGRGLFLALQKEEKEEYDPHLLDAFFMTSDFSTVEMLFSRSEQPVGREELLKVILEGNWDRLSDFVEQQKKSQDLSEARRRNFLLEYARNQSKAAAQLMLKIDGTYAARKLDDSQVMMLLQLADEKSPQAEQFALTLLTSPRSDAVLKLAADRLYEYSGAVIPENHSHKEALAHFNQKRGIDPGNALPPQNRVETKSKTSVKVNTAVIPIKTSPAIRPSSPVVKPAISKPVFQQSPPKVLAKVDSQPVATTRQLPQRTQNKDFYYVVQEGDTLWKIGRRFSVDIEVLRAFNQLETDSLHPGKTLRIPLSK